MAARVSGAATGWGFVDGTRYSITALSAGHHFALPAREEQIAMRQLLRPS